LWDGKGKMWLKNGKIFIGEWKCNRMEEGKMYELQQDNTYTLYEVKYNPLKDIKQGKWIDD
jgi:hypothetical protein